MRKDLMTAVLNCGPDDLDLLDSAKADLFKIVNTLRKQEIEISLSTVLGEVFHSGVWNFSAEVTDTIEYLEKQEALGTLTAEDKECLDDLRAADIKDPKLYDFDWYVNFRDTHLYGDSGKKDIYLKYFSDEIKDLEDYTGFDVEW